jgi:hypothetical protein
VLAYEITLSAETLRVSVTTKRSASSAVAGGEPERAGVGLEAGERRLAAQRLVRLPVVLVVEEVGQPQLEGAAIVVDVGCADKPTQDLGLRRLVEFLDLAVALWIGSGAEHEVDVEAVASGGGVVGAEARTAIEKQDVHEPEPPEDDVQAAQEQLRGLVGTYHDAEREPGGVVEEEHGHALAAPNPGAEVLVVGEHHHHAVRIGESPPIGFLFGGHAAQWQAEADARAPDRGPVDALVWADHAELEGAPDQLGDRGVAVTLHAPWQ